MNEQPQEAIFVKLIDENDKLAGKAKRLREINTDISAKLKKFEIPQGPAWINGRWE